MKKSNTLTRSIIAFVLATLMVLSAFALLSGNQVAIADAPVLNKTATIKTTLDTRISKELGEVKQATIEFDLFSSDLKSAKNLAWCDSHTLLVDETSVAVNHGTQTLDCTNPSVVFALDSYSPEFDANMLTMLTNTVGDTMRVSKSIGFEYQANGIIRNFSRFHWINGGHRRNYALTEIVDGQLQWNADSTYLSFANTHPAGPYYYGDISEVKNFLNAGYSYKIEQFIGKINSDGTITYGNTMCQDGHARENYSLAVFKKAIGATEWQLSFGWYLGREDSASATFAGMEIISGMDTNETALGANTAGRGQYRPEVYNTVTMEIDNLAIYSNRNKVDADVIAFDDVANEDFYLNDEEGVSPYLGSYSGSYGQCFGWPGGNGWDFNVFTQKGVKFNLVNTAPGYMATYTTCNLNTYKTVNLIIDGETQSFNLDASMETVPLPENEDFEKQDYTLVGWLNSNGDLYKPGEEFTLTGNDTLEAIYLAIENYDGASVRVKDNEGIRFMTLLGGNLDAIEDSYVLTVAITDGEKSVSINADKSKYIEATTDVYASCTVLTGLEGAEQTEFKADASIVITYHDDSTLTFSAEDMTEGRSYIQVVTSALEDVEDAQDIEYLYEVTVGGVTKYSRYWNPHYDAMLAVYESVTGNAFAFAN